ncbi:MAG: GGDEF domain-containing protein [Chloroflexi bacterium]|nr:GGDEF domain-containing protein [Chloroflexota bacterium]
MAHTKGTTGPAARAMQALASQAKELRARLDPQTIVLLVVLWVGSIVAALRPMGYDVKLVLMAVGVVAIGFILLVRFLSHNPYTRRFLPLRIGISTALASLALYSGRELINELALVFLIPILYYATRFGTSAGLATAITSSLALFVVYLLQQNFGIGADFPGIMLFVVVFYSAALIAGVVTDESQRKISALVAASGATDGLTGLASRRHFNDILTEEFQCASRNRSDLRLVMLVVDGLQHLNETYGRKCGDAILQEIAGLVGLNVEVGDVVARYSGGTFVAVLPGASKGRVAEVEERLVSSLARYVFQCNGRPVEISVAVGSAVYPGPGVASEEDLLRMASAACRRAGATRGDSAGMDLGRL